LNYSADRQRDKQRQKNVNILSGHKKEQILLASTETANVQTAQCYNVATVANRYYRAFSKSTKDLVELC